MITIFFHKLENACFSQFPNSLFRHSKKFNWLWILCKLFSFLTFSLQLYLMLYILLSIFKWVDILEPWGDLSALSYSSPLSVVFHPFIRIVAWIIFWCSSIWVHLPCSLTLSSFQSFFISSFILSFVSTFCSFVWNFCYSFSQLFARSTLEIPYRGIES